ncbi:uncharacterized protein LOC117329842 [Pecten maximus]|uniref:uncharacterized protein LOC117329842 n=1 Tax=Pecten maximus TaxID=6579 RepID=UPI001458668C|nr:uncharacterized protein LOC117329842 [Pecten maximus]
MTMALPWVILTVMVIQIPRGHGQWTGLTSYVTVSDKSLDMLFIFDTANDDMFHKAKDFTVDTLASADINGDLVHVGLMTFSGTGFFLHHRLNNAMDKDTLQSTIMTLPKTNVSPLLSFSTFNDLFSESEGGRPYVHNITTVFVSNYSTKTITNALQTLDMIDFDSEVSIVGLQLYNATDLMSYAEHSFVMEDIAQLDSFTAVIFFNTFTDDCYYGNDGTTTTTIAPTTPALSEWTQYTKEQLILDTDLLSSTIRKKTSASDSRTSSALIGYVGFIIVLVTVLLPIIVDIPTFIRHAKLSIKYQKKYKHKKLQLRGK